MAVTAAAPVRSKSKSVRIKQSGSASGSGSGSGTGSNGRMMHTGNSRSSIPISLSQSSTASTRDTSHTGERRNNGSQTQVVRKHHASHSPRPPQQQQQQQQQQPVKRSWMEACMDWTPYRKNKKRAAAATISTTNSDPYPDNSRSKAIVLQNRGDKKIGTVLMKMETADSGVDNGTDLAKSNADANEHSGRSGIISNVASRVLTTFQTPLRKITNSNKNNTTNSYSTDGHEDECHPSSSDQEQAQHQSRQIQKQQQELDAKKEEIKHCIAEMVQLQDSLKKQSEDILATKGKLEKASDTARTTELSLDEVVNRMGTKQSEVLAVIDKRIQEFEEKAGEKIKQLTERGKDVVKQVDAEASVLDSVKDAFRSMMEGAKRHGEVIWKDVKESKGDIDAAKEEMVRIKKDIEEMKVCVKRSMERTGLCERVRKDDLEIPGESGAARVSPLPRQNQNCETQPLSSIPSKPTLDQNKLDEKLKDCDESDKKSSSLIQKANQDEENSKTIHEENMNVDTSNQIQINEEKKSDSKRSEPPFSQNNETAREGKNDGKEGISSSHKKSTSVEKRDSRNGGSKIKKGLRRVKRKLTSLNSWIPSSVELPSYSEGNEVMNLSPLTNRSFGDIDANDLEEYTKRTTKNPTSKVLSDKMECTVSIEKKEARLKKNHPKRACRYNLRSASKVAAAGKRGTPLKSAAGAGGKASADLISNAKISGAGKDFSVTKGNSTSHVRENSNHGNQKHVPASQTAAPAARHAPPPLQNPTTTTPLVGLSQNKNHLNRQPNASDDKKGSHNRHKTRSGKVRIQFKPKMLSPAPQTPVYKTPVTSVRKVADSSLSATSGPTAHARKRKRSACQLRARIGKRDRSKKPNSDSLNRNMLGSLRLSMLSLSDANQIDYAQSSNPPPIAYSPEVKDMICPNGLEALSAPTLPELDEIRYRPTRRILKARSQGIFCFENVEDDGVFDFS